MVLLWLLLEPAGLRAQVSFQIAPGMAGQFQVPQPPVEVIQAATAAVSFDPPVVRAGETAFYRVTIAAAESAIQWPDPIDAPPELKLGAAAHGQSAQVFGTQYRPATTFLQEIRATAAGHYTISNFTVSVNRQQLLIPAASLDVTDTNAAPLPAARRLHLELSATNIFVGQPVRVRVLLPAAEGKTVDGVRDVQFNGAGFMTDKTAMRMSITSVEVNDQIRPGFIFESAVTPMAAGPLSLSAQGFTAPPFSVGPISITSAGGPITLGGAGQVTPVFLVSDAVALNVRPVPLEKSPAGFTGTIGKFYYDPPRLSTNRMRVGEPVSLKVVFHGDGELTRLVPPATPRARDWQIIADPPPAIGFTLIPQSDETTHTPAIPFSYFDPETAKFVDLTIPPQRVTVVGESLPLQLAAADDELKTAAPLKLSSLAPAPGKAVTSLKPLQLRGWFIGLQLLPVLGFLALWRWDRRRRFLEAHPDLVRRLQARRALRRVKRRWQQAVVARDAASFVRHAADAMRIAVSPHLPADPQALVCADVLAQLDEAGSDRNRRLAQTVRMIFAVTDARFAVTPQAQADLLVLRAEVADVLQQLEEKL